MPFVIFHLKARIERKTRISIMKSSDTEQPTPSDLTSMAVPLTSVHRSQGKGRLQCNRGHWQNRKWTDIVSTYPTVTSKMFEPTDEETAMSPLPCFATRTLVIKSGTEVPAARKVKPITCQCNNDIKAWITNHRHWWMDWRKLTGAGIFMVSPATVAHQTIR